MSEEPRDLTTVGGIMRAGGLPGPEGDESVYAFAVRIAAECGMTLEEMEARFGFSIARDGQDEEPA